jgi:hypothetical protein
MSRISKNVNILFCLGFALLFLLPVGRAEGAGDNEPNLLELARKKFGTLNKAEEKLFRKVVKGQLANYSGTWLFKIVDPNEAMDWDENTRVIRAKCIAWLCNDPQASAMVTHKGIQVKGACIDYQLDLRDTKISFPLYFEGSVFTSGIWLRHAEIRSLNLPGTHTGPIYGMRLKVDSFVYLNRGFKAEGVVSLTGATIGGDFSCSGGQFVNKGDTALYADGINIKGSIYLRRGFKAEGEVNLVGATIGGQLDCSKGQFINKGAIALSAISANFRSSVILREGFKAEGEVNLVDAEINGYFIWKDVNSPEGMTLDLRSASISTLYDDANSWPGKGKLFLHGLVYNEIDDEAPRDAESRIEWLRRQKGYWPQPYEQLAEVLRKGGQDEDARKVLIAKNKDKARLTELKALSEKIWYRVLGPMIGYGYRPLNALWGVAAFVALGSFLFGIGYCRGLVTPQSESAYVKRSTGTADGGTENRQLSDVYPRFNFLVYSFDTFVPLIDLHQAKYWLPNANRGFNLLSIKGFSLHIGGLLRLYLWIHLTMGWALSMLLVVGLTGLVRT